MKKYLQEYVEAVGKKFPWSELSYFEMNLETWRQLWRVLEMSDIVLFIVDIRFPVRLLFALFYVEILSYYHIFSRSTFSLHLSTSSSLMF